MASGGQAAQEYESKFANWEIRASVRSKPRRVMDADGNGLLFFPPESVPAVSHELVTARGAELEHRVLVHSLYQYLHFTTVLEQLTVLPVTARLSLNRSGLELPVGMRADAFKITTDEAWHAQFSYDFTNEVERVTAIPAIAVVEPGFVRLLDRVRSTFEPSAGNLVDLVFAVVSETLVSSLLSDIPKDRRLPVPVRELVADHAADEGRHHAYFRYLLRWLWPQLSLAEQRMIGPRIPEFINVFLRPDLFSVASVLRVCSFSEADISTILHDSYGQNSPVFTIEPAARATVRAFAEVGAVKDPATRDAFAAAGLLPSRLHQ